MSKLIITKKSTLWLVYIIVYWVEFKQSQPYIKALQLQINTLSVLARLNGINLEIITNE